MVPTKRRLQAGLTLLFSPAKAINYGKYVATRERQAPSLPYAPFALDIEPTTYCNFKCRMCQVSTPGFKHRHMEFALFKKIIDENPQLITIKLQGMGEPLLCPDIFRMIAYANRRRIFVETTSNGSCFNGQFVDSVLKIKLASLSVSMDGATKEVFERIRVGSDFDKVVTGVRGLIRRLKTTSPSTDVRAWTVLQSDNVDQADDIVRLCHDMGFSHLVFQPVLTGWGKESWHAINERFRVRCADDDYASRLETALETGRALGFPVKLHTGDRYSFNHLCFWPWYSSYITADGDLVPCSIIADAAVKTFGNLKHNTLHEIWHGHAYEEFRRQHRDREIPSFCRHCYKEHQTANG